MSLNKGEALGRTQRHWNSGFNVQLLAKFEDVTEWPYSQRASQGLTEKSFVDKENIQLKQNSLHPREDAWSKGSL